MSPEVAILQRMQAVVPTAAARMYMLKLPQQTALPAAVVQLVDDPKDYHLRGGSGFGRARVQVDVYAGESSGADPYADAETLAGAIHGDEAGSGLSGFQGVVGGSPDGLMLTGVFRVDKQATYEADELRVVRIRQDYHAFYKQL
jgi:hypothetical protein